MGVIYKKLEQLEQLATNKSGKYQYRSKCSSSENHGHPLGLPLVTAAPATVAPSLPAIITTIVMDIKATPPVTGHDIALCRATEVWPQVPRYPNPCATCPPTAWTTTCNYRPTASRELIGPSSFPSIRKAPPRKAWSRTRRSRSKSVQFVRSVT